MAAGAELSGPDLRALVEGITCTDQDPLAARLTEAQDALAERHRYVATGHEIEFVVRPISGGRMPDRQLFYGKLVASICDGSWPMTAGKGVIVHPRASDSPLLVQKDISGRYRWDDQGPIMEVATAPSTDWRESSERYWNVINRLGEVAARYGCRAKVLATHMSSSLWWENYQGRLVHDDNLTGSTGMLLAQQYGWDTLQPLEPYSSLVQGRAETYPSKAARRALHEGRVETRYPRYPVAGVADTRLEMLGALAGVQQKLDDAVELDHTRVHACRVPHLMSSAHLELDGLNSFMVWDQTLESMVLPESIPRNRVLAAFGKPQTRDLDMLVEQLSDGNVTDFSADNGAVLRAAISELKLDSSRLAATRGVYELPWVELLRNSSLILRHTRRIIPPARNEPVPGFVRGRYEAMASPAVAAILGRDVLKVLTAPEQSLRLVRRLLAK